MITYTEIQELTGHHGHDGFVVDRNGRPVTEGFVVGTQDTVDCDGPQGSLDVLRIVERSLDYCIMCQFKTYDWDKDGTYWYDAVILTRDYDTAISLALHHNRASFYDLTNCIECRFRR